STSRHPASLRGPPPRAPLLPGQSPRPGPMAPRLQSVPVAYRESYRSDTAVNSEPKRPRAGFAALVASGILLRRLSGFVRQKVFAQCLGNSDAAGVCSAAYRIPNFLQNLFGEGVLSASFIPVYARLLAEGEEELAGRVAGIVASLLALTVA